LPPEQDWEAMGEVSFNSLDLNLLRVLDALLEERSATRAGERLGLSQSAVSHALNRLRYALGDELFVRSAAGLQPTARAVQIGARVRQGLLHLQTAVTDGEFAPATTDRQFVIACSDYGSAAIVPGLTARLRDRAPGASLRVVPSHVGVAEALQTGRVDLGIGSFAHIPDRFASEDLFQETLVWVLSADHPAAREPMTLERLAELPHLIIALTGEDPRAVDGVVSDHGLEWRLIRDDAGAFQGALSSRGLRRRIGLTVPHVLAAPRIVARTDMAALIPRRLAVAYAERYRLRLFDPPYPSPPHAVTAVWDGGHGEQAPIAWFRRLLREAALEVASGNRHNLFTVQSPGLAEAANSS
jgi:DNA-binding transcriptional LysR family regulator